MVETASVVSKRGNQLFLGGLALWLLTTGLAVRMQGQAGQAPPAQTPVIPPATEIKADEADGTPITSDVVKRACGSCHKTDGKGRMSRISFRRTTPEGWQETVRRMVTLNKAELEPDQARQVVKYLADHLGLAPEELKPGLF